MPGRRRRPPRRCACPPARTQRGAEPGRNECLPHSERRCACDETGDEREQPGEIGQIGFRVHPHRRLSHWDTTFSCTLCGRCVEVSRYSPYLRPSAAICTTVSVESRADLDARIHRADVMRLVDDDRAGLSGVPRPPQRRRDGLGYELLLRCRAERPPVDHRAPCREVSQLRDERGLLWVPDAPAAGAHPPGRAPAGRSPMFGSSTTIRIVVSASTRSSRSSRA
jgi:hypothetical protein